VNLPHCGSNLILELPVFRAIFLFSFEAPVAISTPRTLSGGISTPLWTERTRAEASTGNGYAQDILESSGRQFHRPTPSTLHTAHANHLLAGHTQLICLVDKTLIGKGLSDGKERRQTENRSKSA
jgi:hypothetical protein